MIARWLLIASSALVLAACELRREPGEVADGAEATVHSDLEAAAIEAGILPDQTKVTLSGAFERVSDLGTDKFCAVGGDDARYRIGILAVFGPDTKCEAVGQAQRDGEEIAIELIGEDSCKFTASFDGVQLRVPGSLPEGCDSHCGARATFAGTSYDLVGEGDDVARSTRGREYKQLCGG